VSLVKYNNNSISAVTSAASMPSGAMTLIKTLTASSSGTLSFVNGSSDVVLDSTYPIYKFEFINIHPATDDTNLQVGFRDGGTNYDATKTTTFFRAYHEENGSAASLAYNASLDLAQSTAFQPISFESGNDADLGISGTLELFNPSSTTFVKHFLVKSNICTASSQTVNSFIAGYCNTTTAIDAVQFKMSSGNMDSGKIKLYGIKDS